MSQFRIRGIDYADENLQHGLGKGSGRGRPVGSKNGQVMPGAAYMKDYKIVGQKAVGEPARPGATNTRSTALKTIGTTNTNTRAATQPVRTSNAGTTRQRASNTQLGRTASTATSTPASKVEKGKQALASLTGDNYVIPTQQQKPAAVMQGTGGDWRNQAAKRPEATPANTQQAPVRNRDMSTKELRDLDPVGDWPWSNRRVKAAGGLEAREGRQIVYDNPTLSDDYKKQVAKKYGDSDGKSYPKYLENVAAQPNKADAVPEGTNADQKNPAAAEPNAAEQAVRGTPVEDAARQVAGKAVDLSNRPAVNSSSLPNDGQPAGEPANATTPSVETAAKDVAGKPAQANAQPEAQTQQTAPAAKETPEQKSFWDQVGGWFNQAGKDIGDTVVGAWNTTGKAVSDAANWVGEQTGPVGEWAKTAYNDVSEWVGDRGKDLNAWWNGRDVEVNDNGRWRQGHEAGVGEQIGNAANAVGQWIGNAANDVGNAVGNAANGVGRAVGDWWNGRDVEVNDNGRWRQGHEAGVGEQLGNAANAAGQWIGARAQDVGNFVNGVQPGTPEGTPYWDAATGRYVDPSMSSLAERIGTAASNAGQSINNWWNGTDQTPGVRQNIGNAVNSAGQAVGNWWNGASEAVANGARDLSNRLATADATNRSRTEGVPESDIAYMNGLLANGSINQQTYNNYMNSQANIQAAERAAAQAGWDGVPADVRAMNERENNGFVQQPVNWLNDNIVAPVSNAASGVGDFVRNTANSAGQAIGNAANAAGQWAGNAANDVRNWAGNTAQNVRDTADVAGLAGRAVAAGVPMDLVSRWAQNYNNGQISPREFEDLMDRWMSNNR